VIREEITRKHLTAFSASSKKNAQSAFADGLDFFFLFLSPRSQLEEKISKHDTQKEIKQKLAGVALGTSKLNYLDPR
jgi:hypothetical protein